MNGPAEQVPHDIVARRRGGWGEYFAAGTPWVWTTAAAIAASILIVGGLLLLIAVRGLGHFWPAPLVAAQYAVPGQAPRPVLAEVRSREEVTSARLAAAGLPVDTQVPVYERLLLKVGNRDVYGADFQYAVAAWLVDRSHPAEAVVFERTEWGNFHGFIVEVISAGQPVAFGEQAWEALLPMLDRAVRLREQAHELERDEIGSVNYRLERLRLAERRLELEGLSRQSAPDRFAAIDAQRERLNAEYAELRERLDALRAELSRDSVRVRTIDGSERVIPLANIVRAWRPNAMSLPAKVGHYFAKLWEFVSDDPREANTEGGIFPAIFGTVMMVLLMSVFVTPFGIVAAVYLREYAHQGLITQTIRIAVNNLAGVPSIVYGVFGLGFFVYFVGGSIDRLFYPEAAPAPVFGTPGLLWSSLTLAILTLPVVIVATEEGLARIPRSLREASLALGATRAETLWRVVLPMASPAMMTGLILAIARAAGEVAPLMLVGVVKLAPSLPLDGNFPYLHLERKFMHLGFHIYDVGFQSPNVEAARPLVYATSLLLVVVIMFLNLTAVHIRNRLRERYKALEQ